MLSPFRQTMDNGVPAPESISNRDFRNEARSLVRQWLASDEIDVLSTIDTLGGRAIRAASEASARLDRGVSVSQSAGRSLENLQALAARLEAPPRRRALSFFGRGTAREEDARTQIEALVETLDDARDNVARSLITIDSDIGKLRAAAAALDDALLLIRACALAADSAGRELLLEQPIRARFLCDTVRARLLSREQDVATQAAVTQQGVLTLQLLLDGQDALAQALARARDTSVAALRTAIAARRAIAGSQDMARQAAALEQTAQAAGAAPAARGDLQRVLDDAIDQARRAIRAAETMQGGTPL